MTMTRICEYCGGLTIWVRHCCKEKIMSNYYISKCCGEQVIIKGRNKDGKRIPQKYFCLACHKECEVTAMIDTPNDVPKEDKCEICNHGICPACHECHNQDCDIFCEPVKLCWDWLIKS
jgi:hypothetical protein